MTCNNFMHPKCIDNSPRRDFRTYAPELFAQRLAGYNWSVFCHLVSSSEMVEELNSAVLEFLDELAPFPRVLLGWGKEG